MELIGMGIMLAIGFYLAPFVVAFFIAIGMGILALLGGIFDFFFGWARR